jgi:hypothetical protein
MGVLKREHRARGRTALSAVPPAVCRSRPARRHPSPPVADIRSGQKKKREREREQTDRERMLVV